MKRFLSILISMVIMSAMVLPVGVFAEGEETANPVLTIPVTQDQSVISNKNDSTVAANPYTVKNLLVANTTSAQRRHALMEFNCSANAEQLAAIKDATKIELVLTFTGATGTNSLLLYNIPDAYDDTWEEDTVTWNSVTNILTSGEELAKIENAKISTLTKGDLLEIDVTDYVKNDANGILGFRFYTDVNKDITFASKENTEYTGPVLKVYLPKGYTPGDAAEINASGDTFIYGANDTTKETPYGSNKAVLVDSRTNYKAMGFIRFDGFEGLDVKSSKIELKLYVTSVETKGATQVDMKVYGITDEKTSWKEDELTYNTATSLMSGGTELETKENISTGEVTIDVTDYVQAQSDGAYVFRLESVGGIYNVGSRESDNQPVLYVNSEAKDEIWFADADGYTEAINDGDITAKITKTDGADGVLIVALYENVNGSLKLLNVITDNEATVDGANKIYEKAITVSDSANQVVKAFFVDSMQNIIPLVAAKELK